MEINCELNINVLILDHSIMEQNLTPVHLLCQLYLKLLQYKCDSLFGWALPSWLSGESNILMTC